MLALSLSELFKSTEINIRGRMEVIGLTRCDASQSVWRIIFHGTCHVRTDGEKSVTSSVLDLMIDCYGRTFRNKERRRYFTSAKVTPSCRMFKMPPKTSSSITLANRPNSLVIPDVFRHLYGNYLSPGFLIDMTMVTSPFVRVLRYLKDSEHHG